VSQYIEEQPRVVTEGAPLYKLAERLADWIEHDDRWKQSGDQTEAAKTLPRGWVAGMYGGRGSGKTSLLLTLVEILRKHQSDTERERPKCVLPNLEDEHRDQALFMPSATRLYDDSLFLLLDHLERRGGGEPAAKEIARARQAEVQRKDTARFIEYERDVSISSADMPTRLMKVHRAVARTTFELKDSFNGLVRALTGAPAGKNPVLPLFIDDLDLQPHRALEVLEIVHLFLNVPGVVVIIAADKDLLLHAIERALKDRGIKKPGLAGALLAKYVPYEWALPTPPEEERFGLLWGQSDEDPYGQLRRWWPEDASVGLRAAEARLRSQGEYQATRRQEHDAPPDEDEKAEALARRFIQPFLPVTYRGIVALHNRLSAQHDRFAALGSHEDPAAGSAPLREHLRRRYTLKVDRRLLAPFLSILMAIDVRWPELGLIEALEAHPADLEQALESLLRSDVEEPRTQWTRRDEMPLLDNLVGAPRLGGRDLGQAKRLIVQLGRIWKEWAPGGEVPKVIFLAVSQVADAVEAAKEVWRSEFGESEIRRWHVDLRPIAPGPKFSPKDLRDARDLARRLIEERGVASVGGEIEIYAKVQRSLAVWLGWEIRELHRVTVFNIQGSQIAPFPGPSTPVRYRGREKYEVLSYKPREASSDEAVPAADAIVLIDLTGRTMPEQLDQFYTQRGGDKVACKERGRLVLGDAGHHIKPGELVPILDDIIEHIGRLRTNGVQRVHLAFDGLDVVAIFLGQQLKSQDMKISLYEWYTNHYEHVFDLGDDEPDDEP
jgi:hypothetical protein